MVYISTATPYSMTQVGTVATPKTDKSAVTLSSLVNLDPSGYTYGELAGSAPAALEPVTAETSFANTSEVLPSVSSFTADWIHSQPHPRAGEGVSGAGASLGGATPSTAPFPNTLEYLFENRSRYHRASEPAYPGEVGHVPILHTGPPVEGLLLFNHSYLGYNTGSTPGYPLIYDSAGGHAITTHTSPHTSPLMHSPLHNAPPYHMLGSSHALPYLQEPALHEWEETGRSGSTWAGSTVQHGHSSRSRSWGSRSKRHSGDNSGKRTRRKFGEIERVYTCTYANCDKAYGTLNHLNTHINYQKHGERKLPSDFKEVRERLKQRKLQSKTVVLPFCNDRERETFMNGGI